MKKEKSVLHLCEGTLLALVILLIMDLYLLKFLQDPEVSYYPILHLMEAVLALLVVTLALSLIQRELLSRLIVKAFRDITGVHNKTSLEKLVQDLSNRPSTFGVGVMMFDLNNLKYVNDTYGHEKGDEFIQTFTYCLTRILDSDSFLARYGGDEFILIQQNTSLSELQHMAEKLDSLVQEYNTRTTLPLSYAIGYEVSFQNHYFMMEDLINAADKKMYQDKAIKKIAAIRELAPSTHSRNTVIPAISSEALSEKIRQIQKSTGSSLSIALISTDIENFHYINDKYGYSLGDEILNIVYEELAGASFTILTTRFFSDVFVSIADITDLTSEALLSQIAKLDQQISQRIRNTYHVNFFRTNSGICFIPDAETSPETVLSCANVARRLSKKMIPPCCIYSREIDRQEKMQAEILHSFHQALKNEEFQIYFQPKVSPTNGKISSAEVLVRWLRDEKTLWSPAVYIPLFEQNGFIISLDYYVYETAFQWLADRREKGLKLLSLSLNVSPVHFRKIHTFTEKVSHLIQKYEIPSQYLIFEITETTYIHNIEAVNHMIRFFHEKNIRISMDDFGSGYSSLNTLKDILFDEVKIDKKFLSDRLTENGKIVLQEIFHLLKRTNKFIVCEGVETKEMVDFLVVEGCDELQGYYYYKPMEMAKFEQLIG